MTDVHEVKTPVGEDNTFPLCPFSGKYGEELVSEQNLCGHGASYLAVRLRKRVTRDVDLERQRLQSCNRKEAA